MQPRPGIINIFTIAACVLLAGLAGFSFLNLKKVEREFNSKKVLLVKENIDFKYRIEAIQEALNKKTESFDIVEKEKMLIEGKIELLKQENETLIKAYKENIVAIKKKNSILRKKISILENSSVIQRIKEAATIEGNESIKQVLEEAATKIEMIKDGKHVNLAPIVVTNGLSSGGVFVAEGTEGAILSVERDHGIIVINLGKKDGISEGCRLRVFKGDVGIAGAEVVGIRYRVSAAVVNDIQPKYTISDIKENDKVLVAQQ